VAASKKPKPVPPPPVGDACLVGTWRDNGGQSTTTYDGTTVSMYGGAGNEDHIAASGADTNVFGPDTLPLYGTYNGSTLEEALQGERLMTLHANSRDHQITMVEHGWTVDSTDKYVYQGSTTTGTFNKPSSAPTTEGYRCTSTTLTWLVKGKATDTEARVSDKP
jgi:hypothetical protein